MKPSQCVGAAPNAIDDVEAMLARLDLALTGLTESFQRAARVDQLRFLVGLTTEETAADLGLSVGTVKREWTFARAWLAAALDGDRPPRQAPSRDRVE